MFILINKMVDKEEIHKKMYSVLEQALECVKTGNSEKIEDLKNEYSGYVGQILPLDGEELLIEHCMNGCYCSFSKLFVAKKQKLIDDAKKTFKEIRNPNN